MGSKAALRPDTTRQRDSRLAYVSRRELVGSLWAILAWRFILPCPVRFTVKSDKPAAALETSLMRLQAANGMTANEQQMESSVKASVAQGGFGVIRIIMHACLSFGRPCTIGPRATGTKGIWQQARSRQEMFRENVFASIHVDVSVCRM